MLDNKGYFYIIDAFLAVVLLLIAFLIVNSAISIETPDYSYDSKDIRTAQDIMELLSGKVNFTDATFIGDISGILEDNKNSKDSVRQVSRICRDKFSQYNLKNYRFTENNVLKGKELASSGDYAAADRISSATRDYGDYSYTLSVWQ